MTGKQNSFPTDTECINIATEWLKNHGMYPKDILGVTATQVDGMTSIDINTGITTSYWLGTEVAFDVIYEGTVERDAINVVIGDNGALVRMRAKANKLTIEQYFEVPLKDISQALAILEDRLTSPIPPKMGEVPLECLISHRSLSSLEITGIELQYQNTITNDYLLPIFVFAGRGNDNYEPGVVHQFNGKVDAILH